jgi:hypothetical protein
MSEGGEQWVVLSLPAIKETDDIPDDPRIIGDALWPERHSIEKLNQVRSQNIRSFQNLYQQNPLPVQVGGEFYKFFRAEKHIKILLYNTAIPLHLSFDFNVNPYMTCTVWQMSGSEVKQIAEICPKSPNNTTKGICNEVKRLYPDHKVGMFIYGDPSGAKKDTRLEAGFNDYNIIKKELAGYKPTLRVSSKAPGVVARANFINTILEIEMNGISLGIDSRCTYTIKDYLHLKEEADGTKKKEKVKDSITGVISEKYGHTSDANDYFPCQALSKDFEKYQGKGNSNLYWLSALP